MRKLNLILCFFCLLIFMCPASGQSVNHVWSRSIGGPTGFDQGTAIVADGSGNSYITGKFSGVVDFDPGPGVVSLTSAGVFGEDVFIMKLNPAGSLLWVKQVGGSGFDDAKAVALDGAGNILVTGYYESTADFDPGTAAYNLTASGTIDVFVVKLDPSGNFIWAKSMGGSSNDEVNALTVDAGGNVYTTGTFFGANVDFDPGPGTFFLTGSSIGQPDIFVSKLDASGNFVWAKQIGGSDSDLGRGLSLDGNGNLIVTGHFTGTVDFDPGSGTQNLTSTGAGYSAFVLKLDGSGSYIWAREFGALQGNAVVADGSGNIYTTGVFQNTADFDPGSATYNLTSASLYEDIFVSKLDASGNFLWAKAMGGAYIDQGMSIALDGTSGICIGGRFQAAADFDPGPNAFTLSVFPDIWYTSAVIFKLDLSGNFLWARNNVRGINVPPMGGGSGSLAIALDPAGNIYTAGAFDEEADFDPGVGSFILTGDVSQDGFVQKFSQNVCGIPSYTSVLLTSCDSVNLGGNILYSTGEYDVVLQNAGGCDSIINLDLTINNSAVSVLTTTVCDSFSFNGQTYYNSGVYSDTFTNVLGCDSVTTLNLTVKYSSFSTLNHTACDSFTFNNQTLLSGGVYFDTLVNYAGCDSLITLNLQLGNSIITSFNQNACDSFTWNGVTYLAGGTYTDTLATVDGCDSVVTMNLTINTVDVSVTKSAATITATASGASYQWVDCNAGYAAITGETGQSFTATQNGDYAVIITLNGCTDTSECKSVTHLIDNVTETSLLSARVFPNPTNGIVHVWPARPLSDATIKAVNVVGQTVFEKSGFAGSHLELDLREHPAGIYFLEISDKAGRGIFKVVKE